MKRPTRRTWPLFCDHANEVPVRCVCPGDCGCRRWGPCRLPSSSAVEQLVVTQTVAGSIPASAAISLDVYAVVSRAVEEGAAHGWRRAHKYTPTPTDEAAIETIANEVMLALDGVIRWPEDPRAQG